MVNVSDLINENLIYLNFDAADKEAVLSGLAKIISEEKKLCDEKYGEKEALEGYIGSLHEREETFSTAVGFSFAIPHGKCKYVKQACLAYARLNNEISWADDESAKHIFMIGVSEENAGNEHLEILIKLSTAILEDDFREKLDKAETKSEVMKLLKDYSSKERTV